MAVSCKAHQISAAALALDHIADGLLEELVLGQHADHKDAVLDETDRAVLELAARICLGMHVRDLFHLEAAFLADREVKAAPDVEGIVHVRVFGREPLQSLFLLKDPCDARRDLLDLLDVVKILLLVNSAPNQRELQRQQVSDDQLGRIALGSSYRDLDAGLGVEHEVRLARDAAALDVDDSESLDAPLLRLAKRRQAVRCLTALADDDDQISGIEDRISVAELGSELNAHRDPRKVLDDILCGRSDMPCGAARHDMDLCDLFDDLVGDPYFAKVDAAVLKGIIQSILHGSGLLVDLLHHEVLVAALVGCLGGESDLNLLLLDHIAVEVVENSFAGREPAHLQVADIVDLIRVLKDRGDVGRHISVIVRDADDHRAVFTGDPDLAGIILEHQLQRVRAADTDHGLGDRVDGADLVLLVIIIHQLDGHFRVRLAVELIAVLEQLVLQFLVVLDDTVVNAHNKGLHRSGSGSRAVSRYMGMRVCLRRVAVGRPARMADTAGSLEGVAAVCLLGQILELAGSLDHLRQLLAVSNRDSRGVISSVFKFLQPC